MLDHDGIKLKLKVPSRSGEVNDSFEVFFASELDYLPVYWRAVYAGPDNGTSECKVVAIEPHDDINGQINIPTCLETAGYFEDGTLIQNGHIAIDTETLRMNHEVDESVFTIPMSEADIYIDQDKDIALFNATEISRALVEYAEAHNGRLPFADRWMDEVAPYLRDAQVLRCPATPKRQYGYAFNARLSGVKLGNIVDPVNTVMAFQSDRSWRNAAGGPEAVPAWPHHQDGNAYGFVDGHAERSWGTPNFDPRVTATATAAGTAQTGIVLELTAASFDQEALQADGPVIVDFWAEWCGPCKPLKLIFQELATEYVGQVKFCSLDRDQAEEIARRYNATPIPCLIMFKDGQEIARHVGLTPEARLKSWIDQHL